MLIKDKFKEYLADFWGLYVLIFGAIMVILSIQMIVLGLLAGHPEAVCFSLPLLVAGGLLVGVMLTDKQFSRVYYRPANTRQYVPEGYNENINENVYQGNERQGGYQQNYTPQHYHQNQSYSRYNQHPGTDYSPSYYDNYGQNYGAPYFGQSYLAYVQYFRKTLKMPKVKTLFIIFLISILGGMIVLIVKGPILMAFPPIFIIAFTFPSFIWVSYVYNKDILEPESRHAIFLTLAWGMFSTLFALVPNMLGAFFVGMTFTAVVVAPLNEEFFKPLGIRKVRDEMNSELDGLIYGVSCGMGFAIIENFVYELGFIFSGDEPAVIWTLGSFIRGVGSTIIHAVGAGFIGFGYARMRLQKKYGNINSGKQGNSFFNIHIAGIFVIAVLLHAGWNVSASLPEYLEGDVGIIASLISHVIVFMVSFRLLSSLTNEGIKRDYERHGNVSYGKTHNN